MTYHPIHEAHDKAKVGELVASMDEHGWQGAPLVAWDEQLLTGAHRFAAAYRIDLPIPTVDVRDLFAAEGLDWDAVAEEEDADMGNWDGLCNALNRLSETARAEYGIDLN